MGDLPLPFTATFPLPPRASPPLHHDPLQSLSDAQNVIFHPALNVHPSQTTSAADVDMFTPSPRADTPARLINTSLSNFNDNPSMFMRLFRYCR
jgi:hypothetical protein